jgi:hypothetical protein
MSIDIAVLWDILKFPVKAIKFHAVIRGKVGIEQIKLCFLLQNENFEVIVLVILLLSAVTNGALLPSTSLKLQENQLVRCLTQISYRYFPPGRYTNFINVRKP